MLWPISLTLLVMMLVYLLWTALSTLSVPTWVVLSLPFLGWAMALSWLLAIFLKQPDSKTLALRADRALGLNDHLTTLKEIEEADFWPAAIAGDMAKRVANKPIEELWPVHFPSRCLWAPALALLATLTGVWIGVTKTGEQESILAAIEEKRQQRVSETEDVFEDWKEFMELTEDKELQEFFERAMELQKFVANPDPSAAMLEMNRLEAEISERLSANDSQSISSEANAIAEALEAFEGMSAVAASIRNEQYAMAAAEVEKVMQELEAAPGGKRELRRAAAVSEMLQEASKKTGEKGLDSLSQSLQKLSEAAKGGEKSGEVGNSELQQPMQGMGEGLAKQGMMRSQGRALSMTRSQLEAMRRQMQGQPSPSGMPSLAESLGKEPGEGVGTAPGGDPIGEETDLLAATNAEAVSGTPGRGNSEITVTSSEFGSAAPVGAAREASIGEYEELSRQAVNDESIPLAHREIIRDYFQRIRPKNEQP